MSREELKEICEEEFEVFLEALKKMGMTCAEFLFMIMCDEKKLSHEKELIYLYKLDEEEQMAIENQIKYMRL